jgi:hypothetical protein
LANDFRDIPNAAGVFMSGGSGFDTLKTGFHLFGNVQEKGPCRDRANEFACRMACGWI